MLWEGPAQGGPGNPGCPQGPSSNIPRAPLPPPCLATVPAEKSFPGREIFPRQHRSGMGKPRAGSVVGLSLFIGLSLAGLLGLGSSSSKLVSPGFVLTLGSAFQPLLFTQTHVSSCFCDTFNPPTSHFCPLVAQLMGCVGQCCLHFPPRGLLLLPGLQRKPHFLSF